MRGTVLVYEGADVNAPRLSLKMQHAAEEEKKKMKKSHWLHERGQLLRCCRSRISPSSVSSPSSGDSSCQYNECMDMQNNREINGTSTAEKSHVSKLSQLKGQEKRPERVEESFSVSSEAPCRRHCSSEQRRRPCRM